MQDGISIKKSLYVFILKSLISTGIIFIILYSINLSKVKQELIHISPLFFTGALILAVFRYVFAVIRWQILLNEKQCYPSIIYLFRSYFISNFYGLGFPTAIGGDIIRIFHIRGILNNTEVAVSTIIIERISGVLSILFIAGCALIINSKSQSAKIVFIPALILLLFSICFVVLLFNKRLQKTIINLVRGFPRLYNQLAKISVTISSFSYLCLIKTLVISAIFQFCGIVIAYLLGLSLGLSLGFDVYLLYIPIIWVIMMFPFSLAGTGVREGAFVYFFTKIGVSAEIALSLSILLFITVVFIGVIGMFWQFIPEGQVKKLNDSI